tara:strand:- start:690 stop:866 length:177 start_codon:yes stop_codon:yes gene_type:complete
MIIKTNMTNRETFYAAIEAMDIPVLQQLDIKQLAIEFAHQERMEGMDAMEKLYNKSNK